MAKIVGTPGNDKLFGTAGKDTITGLAGNDIMVGTSGDYLTGGKGSDTFRLADAASNVHITDFSRQDTIELYPGTYYYDYQLGAIPADAWSLGSSAKDASDRIIYDRSSGSLFVDRDGIGGYPQHLIATLDNRPNINRFDVVIESDV